MNKKMTMYFPVLALILAISQLTGSNVLAQRQAADYVLTNGKIYTVNERQPWAAAVAVQGTDIVYVGDDKGARRFIGNDTTVTDLGGKLMLPGFIDTHHHGNLVMAIATGLMMDTPPDGVGDKDEMLRAVADYVEANPNGPFFSFGGSGEGLVEITRQDIDAIIADQPFLMVAGTGHGGWANTKALEMTGVIKGEPDPIDHFEREQDGTPTGYVGTSAAAFYVLGTLQLISEEAMAASAELILTGTSAYGITATHQVGHIHGMEEAFVRSMDQRAQRGELSVRLSVAAYYAQRPRHIEAELASIENLVPKYNSEMVWVD